MKAVDHLVAALELPQGHMNWSFRLGNVLADNGGAFAVVLSERKFLPRAVDLAHLAVVLRRNGAEMVRGNTETVLGHPAEALAWLARCLAREGAHLRAGDLVMTGSCSRSLTAETGDLVEAQFDVLGSVSVRFA
jgi:2-keto-4-pentenoate hydratase